MSSNETNFAVSLANPAIRSLIRNHVKDVRWGSIISQKIVEFYTGDEYSGRGIVPDAVVKAHFSQVGFMDEEIDSIVSRSKEFISLGSNVEDYIKIFSKFYKQKFVAEILADVKMNPDELAEEVIRRVSEIPKIENANIKVRNLGKLDIDAIRLEEMGNNSTLPTSFQIIRDVMPLRGYLRGSVIQVCGAPGTGKSLFLMNEAATLARAGLKGVYIALGDLMYGDLINRFSSVITGVSLSETQLHPNKHWTQEVQDICSNIRCVVVAAGTIDPDSLCDLIESTIQEEENIDFIMVDYDSNFQKTKESMYEEGDVVYNKMSTLARPNDSPYRAVFVASQPKQQYWDREVIPMEAAAESARKQAIIDLMITLGKCVGARVKCGKINIPKNRRGKADMLAPYQIEESGRFTEIEDHEYILLQGFGSNQPNRKPKTNYKDYQNPN